MMSSGEERRSIEDYKRVAQEKLPTCVWKFYSAGMGDEQTIKDSVKAYSRYRFRPNVMCTEFDRNLQVTVQGQEIPAPVGVAPTAFHLLAHPEGAKATARGAENFNTVMIVSSWALVEIEDIVKAAPNGHYWMQMHLFKNRANTINLVRRAEKLGFKAIVVTCDVPVTNSWKSSYDQEFIARNMMRRIANLKGAVAEIQAAIDEGDTYLMNYMTDQVGSCSKWADIMWLRSLTKLPVIAKGILTAESARDAANAGVDGIIVSAHGGRQLDGVLAPIDALPEVVDAVSGTDIEVYMDGGIRAGPDILKALALGAKMVFIGRPILWGLAASGAHGVKDVLDILKNELSHTMALCGCNKVSQASRSLVRHESHLVSRL